MAEMNCDPINPTRMGVGILFLVIRRQQRRRANVPGRMLTAQGPRGRSQNRFSFDDDGNDGHDVHQRHSGDDVKVNIVNVRSNLADTLNRVAYQGERVILERRGKEVAAIVSMEDLAALERLEDE